MKRFAPTGLRNTVVKVRTAKPMATGPDAPLRESSRLNISDFSALRKDL
jgi:hypothetical protein